MKHVFTALLLVLCLALPAAAQTLPAFEPLPERDAAAKTEALPERIHVSDWLNQTPAAREALADFHRRKRLSLLPTSKAGTSAGIGDVQTFKVLNWEETTSFSCSAIVYDNLDFELRAEHERFKLWVEVAELTNGQVTQEEVDELFNALANETPAASINPSEGVIVNDEAIFGTPPNVDGDGRTDVLVTRIRDGHDGPNGIGGFVFSGDLSTCGNNRDILYLESQLTRLSDFGLVAAHEYQHLIHFNYNERFGVREETFVNEGLAEWAELMNGYSGRGITYLSSPGFYNVNLLGFNSIDSGAAERDYQRAGLWTTYLAERIGPEAVGSITREQARGIDGYNNVLGSLGFSVEGLLLNFHTANLVNDTDLNPFYGYTTGPRTSVEAIPRNTYEGLTDSQSPSTALHVNVGGAEYIVWKNVEDLALSFSNQSGVSNLEARALLYQGSIVTERTVEIDTEGDFIGGQFDKIELVIAHTNPSINSPGLLTYSASWTVEQEFIAEQVVYDDGQNLVTNGAIHVLPRESLSANRFDVPSGAILNSVAVAPYYENQFTGSSVPSNAPSDFELVIWDDEVIPRAEGDVHIPGDTELFKVVVSDDRRNQTGGNLVFKEVDLSEFQAEIPPLPDVIHIGIRNTGTDDNLLFIGLTAYEGNTDEASSISSLHHPNLQGWAPFYAIIDANTDESLFQNQVVPIRATFLVPTTPTASEDETELPERIALHENYPNPFNPATTITYDLPQTARVRLAVYDLLGREVAVLVDGPQAAGRHTARLDATGWASGLYLYRLEAAGQRQTRRMMLVK